MPLDTKANLKLNGYYQYIYGVNINVSELLQRDSELKMAVNLISDKLGIVKKVSSPLQYGVQLVDNKSVLSGYIFIDSAGASHKLGAINNTGATAEVLYEIGTSSNTAKKSDFTVSKILDYATLLNYLFVVNDTDAVATTADLSTWGTVHAVGAPKGKYIEEFNNEPYIAGNATNKQRIYKGKLLNPDVEALAYISGDQVDATTTEITVDSTKYITAGMKIDIYTKYTKTKITNADSLEVASVTSKTTFTITSTNLTLKDSDEIYLEDCYNPSVIRIVWDTQGEDYFDLPPNGESVTGLKKHANRLVIFQNNSMFRWDGAELTPISDTIGCSSDKSIFVLDNKLYWNHKSVLYEYDGSYPVPVSQKIQPILDSMSDYSGIITTGDDAKKRVMFFLGNIACEDLTANNVWAVYYPGQAKWEFKKDINATCAFTDQTGVNSTTMYIGDNDGNIHNFESGNAIAMGYELLTKYECQGRPETVKEYPYIVTKCKKPGGHLYYSLDYNEDYKDLGEITKVTQTFALPIGTRGTCISIKWADKETGKSPEFMGWTILYREVGIE